MLLASVGFQILEQHERNAGFAPFAGEFRRDVSIPAGATAGSAEHDIQIAIAVDVSASIVSHRPAVLSANVEASKCRSPWFSRGHR